MADTIRTELELLVKGNMTRIDADISKLSKKLDGLEKKAKGSGKSIGDGFSAALPDLTKAGAALAVGALAVDQYSKALSALFAKETELADYSAITGITGKSLVEYGESATELSNKFGTSVVENITSFKGVVSKLGPAFGSSKQAMDIMAEDINILSLASGLTAPAAMEAITTSMLQFGTDLSSPIEAANQATIMMNVLAAGAKLGAAEVPQLSESLVQVGSTAKSLNIPFAETAAALEVLATKGLVGSQAGVGLRNSLVALAKPSKEASDMLTNLNYSSEAFNKTLTEKGIAAAFEELNGFVQKNGSLAEQAQLKVALFGKENLSAASALLDGADAITEFNDGMQNTNTALEQAAIKMQTTTERWKRFTTLITNSLVGTLETGQSAILDFGDALDSWLSKGDNAKAGWDLSRALGSVVQYSTAGIIPLNKWLGIEKEIKHTQEELKATGKAWIESITTGTPALKALQAQMKQAQADADAQAIKDAEDKEKKGEVDKKAHDKMLKELAEYNRARISNITDAGDKLQQQYVEELRITNASDDSPRTKREKNLESLAKYNAELAKLSKEQTDIQSLSFMLKPPDVKVKAEFEDEKDWLTEMREHQEREFGAMLANIDHYSAKTKLLTDVMSMSFQGVGNAIGSALTGKETSFKDSLKSILVSMLDFIEVEFVLAEAAATIRAFATFGVSALADTWGWLAAFAGLEAGKALVNSFAVGSWNIPHDQMAMVHQNEMIIPRTMADSVRSGDAVISSNNAPTTKRRKQPSTLKGSIDINVTSFEKGNRYSTFQYEQGIA